nr:endonuclease III [Lachnospiraceae bacterium]
PSDIDELTSLPGVGRKTANVVRGNIFGIDSIVVDTHVKRISRKLGLTREEDPVKVEFDLMKEVPKDHWILINMQLITFGRQICRAQRPMCDRCRLTGYCSYYKDNKKK